MPGLSVPFLDTSPIGSDLYLLEPCPPKSSPGGTGRPLPECRERSSRLSRWAVGMLSLSLVLVLVLVLVESLTGVWAQPAAATSVPTSVRTHF